MRGLDEASERHRLRGLDKCSRARWVMEIKLKPAHLILLHALPHFLYCHFFIVQSILSFHHFIYWRRGRLLGSVLSIKVSYERTLGCVPGASVRALF